MLIKDDISMPEAEYIPTPSFFLNHLFKGVLRTGGFHTFWGREGSGKTTIALRTAAIAQKMGYMPVIIDTEHALDKNRIERDCGIERPYHHIQKNILEDVNDILLPMMREEGSKYFIIIDSINFLIKQQFVNNDDSQGGMAMPARSQTEFCMKVLNELSVNHLIMILAHTTVDLGGNRPAIVGKFAKMVEHTSANIVKLLPSFSTTGSNPATLRAKGDNTIIYQEIFWEIQKSKQGPLKGTKGSYRFYPATATIDSDREIIKLASRLNILDASSQGWLKLDGKSFRESAVVDMLKNDNEFKSDILNQIQTTKGTYIDFLSTSREEENAGG